MKAARLFVVTMVLAAIGALAWAGPAAAAAGPIAGEVTNQIAQPLAGIKVCAVVFAPYRETCAQTDAVGEYSIPGTGPGYKVHFYDPDGAAPSRAPQWYPGVPHPEEGEAVTEAEIAAGIGAMMGPGAEVIGEVAALGSEAPLGNVAVCAKPTVFRAGEVEVCGETKSDGTFVLTDIGPGSYELHFMPGEGVNYVAASFPFTLVAGDVKGIGAFLRRGVEFEGHLTDGTTGLPVEPFGGPGTTPTVCALEAFSEERVKCVPVGAGGEYAIAGLPPGGYVLVFGADTKEDGVDLYPDGYVRQYYEEGLVLFGESGSVVTGLDATLVRGEEIWPGEEETPWEPIGEEVSDGGTTGGGTTGTFSPSQNQPGGAPAPPRPAPFGITLPRRTVLPKYTCRKGFRRVVKSGTSRCVKIKKKPKKHRPKKHHAKKVAHR
jgi:hypothetical protein